MKSIEKYVEGLGGIKEGDFLIPRVARYNDENPVDPESLAQYLNYNRTHYTRNLIYKSDLFELIAICWEIGQTSQIHNHQNQNCWMVVPIGRLMVQNYQLIRSNEETRFCELRKTNRIIMDSENPSHVDPEMPIHAVLNLPGYDKRATSLHIYSYPYDHCRVYSQQENRYFDVPLGYDSAYGRFMNSSWTNTTSVPVSDTN